MLRGGLIALLLVGAIVGILYTINLNSAFPGLGNKKNSSSPLSQAENIKVQTNLKSISTSLAVFYTENGKYPDSLSESSYGTDTSNIVYKKCSDSLVIFYYAAGEFPGFKLDSGQNSQFSGTENTNC